MAWDRDTWAEHWAQWLQGVVLVLALVGLGLAVAFGGMSQRLAAALVVSAAFIVATAGTAWSAATSSVSPAAKLTLRASGLTLTALALLALFRGLYPGEPLATATWEHAPAALELPPTDSPLVLRLTALPRAEGRTRAQRVTLRTQAAAPAKHLLSWTDGAHVDADGLPIPRLVDRWEALQWLDPRATSVRWVSAEPAGRLALHAEVHPAPLPWPWLFGAAVVLALALAVAEGRTVRPAARTHAAAGAMAAAAWLYTARGGFSIRTSLLEVGIALGAAIFGGGVVGVLVRALARLTRREAAPQGSVEK